MNVVTIDLKDAEARKAAAEAAIMMYVGEPCRICGDAITKEVVKTVVWAGYGKTGGRCAHQECWDACKPKSEWAHPEDSDR